MSKFTLLFFTALSLLSLVLFESKASSASSDKIQWHPWDEALFGEAKKEHKLVVMDLHAVWCHWCHVMDQTTYSDEAVVQEVKTHYIAVSVDQDSRPDISARYQEYGWPATIIFDGDGHELAKRSGYYGPSNFLKLLSSLAKNPIPEAPQQEASDLPAGGSSYLSDDQRKIILKDVLSNYDFKYGSWKSDHKLMDAYFIEEFMNRISRERNAKERQMVRQTLNAQLSLLDPVWGGFYQYSVGGNWKQPHFEKIMSVQTENILAFSRAAKLFKNKNYKNAALSVAEYLIHFLSNSQGDFFTSQDADLVQGEQSQNYFLLNYSQRRAQGIPRLDQHVYARENGWVIEALANLSAFLGEPSYLVRAKMAAQEMIAKRALAEGGFKHSDTDEGGPFLGDSISMGRAFLALYMVTAERAWLERAQNVAAFIDTHFRIETGDPSQDAGYVSSHHKSIIGLKPVIDPDENIHLALFTNLLFHYTGDAFNRAMAERAMKYLSQPSVYDALFLRTGVLWVDEEMTSEPIHLTIVGHKDDPAALELYKISLAFPSLYKRIEWWDKREGGLPRGDVSYPELSVAAAFVCSNGRCSLPMTTPEALSRKLGPFLK